MNIIYYSKRIRGELKRFFCQRNIRIGKGITTDKMCNFIIEKGATISLGDYFSAERNLRMKACSNAIISVGRECFFNTNASITAMQKIIIGDYCKFGNNVVIVDHDHDYSNISGFKTAPIKIGNHVWVGANVVILRGTVIEDYAVIAAGSVVRGRVSAKVIYYSKNNTCMKPYELNI